ncbi:MAG: transporter substrate-binding domain-containing protein, partial [Bauldia sp.]
MISRRELAGMIGMGTAAAAVAAASGTSARAQSAEQSTFDRVMSTKKIRVGGVATGTPWWWKDQASGQWGGQFWDMASALAADIDGDLEVVETTWGNAVLDLQANKIDLMFGLNPTPKRALAIDFSGPVYDSALVVIARPDFEVTTWAALNDPDVKIAVDVGSAHD